MSYLDARGTVRLVDRELYRPGSAKRATSRCWKCAAPTREGKPLCSTHVMEMPYVRDLLDEIAVRTEELNRLARGEGPAPLHEAEVLAMLTLRGPRTIARLAREVFPPGADGTPAQASARQALTVATLLEADGKVVLLATRRGFPALALPGRAPTHWTRWNPESDQEPDPDPEAIQERLVLSPEDSGWGPLQPDRVRLTLRAKKWSAAALAEWLRRVTEVPTIHTRLVRAWLGGCPPPGYVREALWEFVDPFTGPA